MEEEEEEEDKKSEGEENYVEGSRKMVGGGKW